MKGLVAAPAALSLVLFALSATGAPPQSHDPARPAARGDVRRGRSVFVAKSCAHCHAIWGHGGEVGPDLGRTHAGALSDAELAAALWNHVPRMWGKMRQERLEHVPISEQEMADLFAYLSFIRAIDEPGDRDAGRRLLDEKKCSTCHNIGDQRSARGGAAPDLRRWAQYRNPATWALLMFNHAPKMTQEMRARRIAPPTLDAHQLVDMVAYLRSTSPDGDADLLDPGDSVEGERLFRQKRCAACHAVRGVGGRVGPALARRGWETTFTGVAIRIWNREGKMRAAMDAHGVGAPALTPQEMAHVIAYLFAASHADDPGSPAEGLALLRGKGCLNCHSEGVGPPLDHFRGHATPVAVAQALWMHGPTMLERMRDLEVRWPSLSGLEMRHLVAALNEAPPERKGDGARAPGGNSAGYKTGDGK